MRYLAPVRKRNDRPDESHQGRNCAKNRSQRLDMKNVTELFPGDRTARWPLALDRFLTGKASERSAPRKRTHPPTPELDLSIRFWFYAYR